MVAFLCGQEDHLSFHLDLTPAQTYTDGYPSGTNSDIANETSTLNHISSNTSNDMDTINHFSSDTSDEMDTISHLSLDTTNHFDMGNHIGLENLNNIGTESHKSLNFGNNVQSENHVDSDARMSGSITGSNGENLEKRKSSTAFIIDFGSESLNGLSISDKLSRYLPRHVAKRVELRASNVKVRSDRDKTVDKERSERRPKKSVPGLRDHQRQTRHDTNRKPEIRKSLPIDNTPHNIEAAPRQHATNAKKKQLKDTSCEGKRSWSSTLHTLPSYSDTSSFKTPCRNLSCPSAASVSLAHNSRFTSSCSTGLSISVVGGCLDSKKLTRLTGTKYGRHGKLRSNQSYTILSSEKPDEASDSVSESGTYEVDEEPREDILKARRTISRVFGIQSSPKRGAVKPRLVQFTRRQIPAKRVATGSLVNRPGARIGSSSMEPNKSRIRSQENGKIGPLVGSKGVNSVENLGRSASNNQSRKSLKATTQVLQTENGNIASAGKESRADSHSTLMSQPLRTRLCGFGVSASDHVVNSNIGKAVVSCPVVQRLALVNLRTNRTFELRCARVEANAAVASRNAEKASLLLPKIQRRIRKLPADVTQGTSSYTSVCSRESANSSIYGPRDIACNLRELRQNARPSCCSLLQEETLSPADSSTSVTVDGSYTSLDRAQTHKSSHIQKPSSVRVYQHLRGKDKDELLAACSRKGPKFQDKFALNLPEVRAWHERHQNDRSNKAPLKAVPWDGKGGQMKTTVARKEQTKAQQTLLENGSSTNMATNWNDLIGAFPAKNGSELNALKMLLKMSEEINAQLRRINESHVRGTTLALGQQQTVTNAMISAFKNFSQTEKDILDIGKALKIEQR